MRSTTKVIAAVSLVAFFATAALAVEGGNPKKGKYLFRKNCKTCHSEGQSAKNLTPMVKTMAQWDRYFKEDAAKHPGTIMKTISQKDLLDINQFLYDHAADSPQPATCG